MGRLLQFPRRASSREQAYAWLVCIDEGLSAREREELEVWLAKRPQHPRMLIDAAHYWDQTGVLSELAEVFPLDEWNFRKKPFRFHALAAAVAGVAVLVGVAWLVYPGLVADDGPRTAQESQALSGGVGVGATASVSGRPEPGDTADYETAVGEQRAIRLPDGTLVTMNTDTLIRVRYSADERAVILERGEASFDVVANKARPFRVTAGSRIFEAVGTAFNIELVSGENVELTVTEGTVRVTRRELMAGSMKPQRVAVDDSPIPVAFPVTAGQVAKLDASFRPHVTTPDEAVLQAALAWQSGNLVYNGELLNDALAEMDRYTLVRFKFDDETIGQERLSGLYRAGDTAKLIVALESSFGIKALRLGPNRYFLERKESAGDFGD